MYVLGQALFHYIDCFFFYFHIIERLILWKLLLLVIACYTSTSGH